MSQGDDVLSQADALMQRHRSFVARPNQEALLSPMTSNEATEIPVLTEIVEVALPADGNTDLHGRLEQALADWLSDALPRHVEQLGQQLLASVSAEARASLLPRLQALLEDRQTQE